MTKIRYPSCVFRRPAIPALSLVAIFLASCATERPLPTYEKPLAKTEYQHVRTTAYFDGEADHLKYTNHNAVGTCLQAGHINSAAADWSRWPAGTEFQVMETGQLYVVDDYGWALAGTNTIDIYRPSRAAMNAWGVRHVDIRIIRWGDPRMSYETLRPRSAYRHVQRMLAELKPELDAPVVSQPIPPTMMPQTTERAVAVAHYGSTGSSYSSSPSSGSAPQLRPFNSTW